MGGHCRLSADDSYSALLPLLRDLPSVLTGTQQLFVRICPLVNTIRSHHAAHHRQQITMERNLNLTYPIAAWYIRTNDLDRGPSGHLFDGYNTRFVKREFAMDQGDDLDARAKAA